MSSHLVLNLLRLSLGLSVSLLLVKPHAEASVGILEPAQDTANLIGQFEPTDTEPLDADTTIDTTGGRYLYFRPSDDTRGLRGPTTTTGTRSGSCAADGALAFSSLGPRSMVGLTTQVRPEFSWYITEAEAASPVLFRLLAVDESGQTSILGSAELLAEPGFMQYQLPETAPPLEVGKDYLWQVIVRCDPEGPSRFLASTLPLQVVTPDPELTEALTAATTDVERASLYGSAGIWYDALALVTSGINTTAEEIRTGLLQDLAAIESDDEIFSATLTAIAEQTAPDDSPGFVPSSVSPLSILPTFHSPR
ncbi:MAG: DUF928 domain-containing protein [Cyanobacteria bacterium P01_H01_bin.26]